MFGKWTQRGVVEAKSVDYHDTIDKFYFQHEIVVLKVALTDEKQNKLNFREMYVVWFKPEALFLSANSNRSARAQMEEG